MSECIGFSGSGYEGNGRNNGGNSRTTRKTNKEYEKCESRDRKRALLHLIAAYLRQVHLPTTLDALIIEGQLSTSPVELCDNVDLDLILQDYILFYETKFGKPPKVVKARKVPTDGNLEGANVATITANGKGARRKSLQNNAILRKNSTGEATNPLLIPKQSQTTPSGDFPNLEMSVTSLSLSNNNGSSSENSHQSTKDNLNQPAIKNSNMGDDVTRGVFHHQKPLCEFEGYSQEWRELADQVMLEVIPNDRLNVTWEDCIGVKDCIQVLKEAVVYPVKYPHLFQPGLTSPWKGVLLYGPPGTGKTLLARAVAREGATTFINLTSGAFISKWRGDSEKLLRVLFDIARYYAPTTIFIDELDALAGRPDDVTQHEATRRFTSELLIQLDGLLAGGASQQPVFVLATTNHPWNISKPMLRRFEKHLYVGLPDVTTRYNLFQYFYNKSTNCNNFSTKTNVTITREDYSRLAQETSFFSGADIYLICKESLMIPLREHIDTLEGVNSKNSSSGCKKVKENTTKVSKNQKEIVGLREVNINDVLQALKGFKSTCNVGDVKKYETWNNRNT